MNSVFTAKNSCIDGQLVRLSSLEAERNVSTTLSAPTRDRAELRRQSPDSDFIGCGLCIRLVTSRLRCGEGNVIYDGW